MAVFEQYTPEEVCEFLRNQAPNLSEEVLDRIIDHKIDGEVFLELNDEYLSEISPLVGDRFKIKKAINAASCLTLGVSFLIFV